MILARWAILRLVGFDADDTLWRSEDYFDAAQAEFERIVGAYAELELPAAVSRTAQAVTEAPDGDVSPH